MLNNGFNGVWNLVFKICREQENNKISLKKSGKCMGITILIVPHTINLIQRV